MVFSLLRGGVGPTFGAPNTAGGSPPVITSPSSLVTGTVGIIYPTTTFTATGTAPITWSVVSGTLPTGLTFSSGGVLSGTPTATASGSITFRATNAYGFADRALTLTVNTAGTSAVSDPVTYAVTATGTGTTYNVYNDTDMDNVPWGALGAGDAVNIYWKATPYTRKWGMGKNLANTGTVTNPIRINGVTDASGNRPRFNFNGATTARGSNPSLLTGTPYAGNTAYDMFVQGNIYNLEDYGGIIVYGGYASKPSYIQFKNLEIYGARGTFTNLSSATQSYITSTSAIRFQTGADCLVENCVISDCGWGVYTHIDGPTLGSTFERLTLRNSRLFGCGVVGSATEHNAYIQCVSPVIEGNYFGPLVTGAAGSSYKSRSSGEIFRYNWVETNARAVDLVEAEEQIDGTTPSICDQSDYGIDHVYGNVIVVDDVLMAANGIDTIHPFHFGGDKNGAQGTIPNGTPGPAALYTSPTINGTKINRQKLFFYNNTYILNTAKPIRLFEITESTGTIEAWNNIFWGSSNGGATYLAGLFTMVETGGNMKYLASTVRYAAPTPAPAASFQHCLLNGQFSGYTDPTKTTETIAQALITSTPNLTSVSTYNYVPQAGGSADGAGSTSFPAGISSGFKNLPVQFQPVKRSNGMVARPSLTTVGALQIGV